MTTATGGVRGYRELLGAAETRTVIGWGLVARLPMGMSTLALVLLVVLSLGGALLAYTAIHLEVTRTGYKIDALEKDLAESLRKERRLRLEAAYLANPTRIERRAATELRTIVSATTQGLDREADPVLLRAAARLADSFGAADSAAEESFSRHLLEYPHYTRPAEWQGRRVPDVLLSGHHAAVAAWREAEAECVTRERRPDLWGEHTSATRAAPVASPATAP